MMFPVLLKTAPDVGSKESVYYLVASNGVFRVVDTDIYRAVTKVDGEIPGLLAQAESLRLCFPPVPATVLGPILAFLRGVFEEHGGEGIVLLFYRPDTLSFRVGVPPQTIPGYRRWDGSWRAYLGLQYGYVQHPPGYRQIGTIHSHASGSAKASHVDCEDERFRDGVHVVYGHIDRSTPSCAASFVADGTRFELDPDEVVERCRVPDTPANPEWMARVERVDTGIVPGLSDAFGSVPPEGGRHDDG